MPKRATELNALQVARLRPPGGFVGAVPGLRLVVDERGRRWLLSFSFAGRRPEMGLGSFPEVGLAEARQRGAAARSLLRQGVNPIEHRKAARRAAEAQRLATQTFAQCAEAFLAAKTPEWSNPKHAAQWRSTLETYAYPVIGELAVGDVDTPQVQRVLAPIWSKKTETAVRLRGRIEKILDWATTSGYRSGPNPARWRGHLDTLFADPNKIAPVKHHAALNYRAMPAFMEQLAGVDGESAAALRFAILTAARSGEVLGANWDEIDVERRTWTVPAERMKSREAHRAALSSAALELLSTRAARDGLVFPNVRTGRQLSGMAMTAVVRRLGVDAVPHGLARATFKTWAAEQTNFAREVIEHALAHKLDNKTEEAYWRGDMFKKRARLMAAWAEFLMKPARRASAAPIRK